LIEINFSIFCDVREPFVGKKRVLNEKKREREREIKNKIITERKTKTKK
jgi:hypothetical protein